MPDLLVNNNMLLLHSSDVRIRATPSKNVHLHSRTGRKNE